MHRRNWRGFTLIEIIVVMVVIAIIATIGTARLMDRSNFDAPAFREIARSTFRFGQKLAIAQNRPVFVSVSASRVALCFDSGCASPVIEAGGNSGRVETLAACGGSTTWQCEAVPNGLSLSVSASPAQTLPFQMFFDAQGRPYRGTDSPLSDLSSFGGVVISIGGGATAQTVTVERETGYVH